MVTNIAAEGLVTTACRYRPGPNRDSDTLPDTYSYRNGFEEFFTISSKITDQTWHKKGIWLGIVAKNASHAQEAHIQLGKNTP